jgi:hypothetical protein
MAGRPRYTSHDAIRELPLLSFFPCALDRARGFVRCCGLHWVVRSDSSTSLLGRDTEAGGLRETEAGGTRVTQSARTEAEGVCEGVGGSLQCFRPRAASKAPRVACLCSKGRFGQAIESSAIESSESSDSSHRIQPLSAGGLLRGSLWSSRRILRPRRKPRM